MYTGTCISSIAELVARLDQHCDSLGDGCDRLAHVTRWEGDKMLRLCRPCAQEFDTNREADAFPSQPEGHCR